MLERYGVELVGNSGCSHVWPGPFLGHGGHFGMVYRACAKGREVQTIRNFQICYALGGFIFMLLPGFLAEAFGTYLVSYAALFFMLIAAAAVIVGLYTICDLKAARNGKDR